MAISRMRAFGTKAAQWILTKTRRCHEKRKLGPIALPNMRAHASNRQFSGLIRRGGSYTVYRVLSASPLLKAPRVRRPVVGGSWGLFLCYCLGFHVAPRRRFGSACFLFVEGVILHVNRQCFSQQERVKYLPLPHPRFRSSLLHRGVPPHVQVPQFSSMSGLMKSATPFSVHNLRTQGS